MSDWLALALLLSGLALFLAIWSGDAITWACREWRLMRAKTWAPPEGITGPRTEENAATRLLRRQKALAKRMRKKGRHLYAGKHYTPALTVATPQRDPPNVVRLRKTKV